MALSFYDTVYPALPIFAQNWGCTAGGWWRFRSRFNRHFYDTVHRWEETGRWSLERLLELQRDRLDLLVERARLHVPYYRDLGPPSDASDPAQAIAETLAAIPPLDKLAYRDQPEAFIARDVPRRRLISGRTSGTTGTALPLWCTPETLAEEYASVWRMRREVGVEDPATPNLTFNGNIVVPFAQTDPPFHRTSAYDHRALFSVYHMTPTNLRSYVDAVHRLPARYIEGYPSAIHLVARALLQQGRPFEPGRIDAIFTSSESLLAFQRETIEKAFGAPVRDRYGVSEKVVSMTECAEGSLHVDMEFCIVEVERSAEDDDTETGSLLVTGLSHDATPLFRYRIGDVGTRSKRPCPCGRAGDVFLAVDGRIEDYVMTPDGRLIGRLDHIFKDQHDVAEAQILQDTKEAVQIRVVPRESWNDGGERALRKEVRARLGDEISVSIELVQDIPREPNGKLRAVKSRVGHLAP
ncbi:MAG: phenylacetate--CoA ligase family protein [Myxococcota bacterium]